MGYGGSLIWTAFVGNLKKAYPDKKVLFVYRKKKKYYFFGKASSDFLIYDNNPDIDKMLPKYKYIFLKRKFKKNEWTVADMTNPHLHYRYGDTKEKIFLKQGKHAIARACEYFGLKNILLKPVLKLTNQEQGKVDKLLNDNNLREKKFIVIEPNTKGEFTINKRWFWDRWQELAGLLQAQGHILVQLGPPGVKVLPNAIDLTGKTSFREAAGVIGQARLFVGCEGGLMHATSAMDTKAVILVSGFESPEMFCYPQNINIYKKVECSPCGLKTPCPYDRKCMKKITVEEVYRAVLKLL